MKTQIFIACFIAVIFPIIAKANDSMSAKTPVVIPIKEAIGKGMVNIRMNGSYTSYFVYEILDVGEGMHYGKCMAIELGSNLDSMVVLKLDAGTLLVPKDDSIQRMIVTHDVIFPLYPRKRYWTRFYAMCTQINFHPPIGSKEFTIGEMADTNLVKLAKYCAHSFNQNMPGQHAIWAYTDKVNFDTLKRYGADSNSIQQTVAILNAVNLETPLNTPLSVKQTNTWQTITLERYWVYGGLCLISILLLTTVFYAIRKRYNEAKIS